MWERLDFDATNPLDVELYRQFSSALDEAMEQFPCSIELWSIKGDFLFGKYMMENEFPTFEDRNACYLKAIQYNPNDSYPYERLGSLYHLHNKELSEAEQYFKKSMELGATFYCYIDLAQLYAEMRRRDLAVGCLKDAIEKFGDDPLINITLEEIEKGLWDPLY